MDRLRFEKSKVLTSGVVTTVNWTMAKDGLKYWYFYCDRWEIITDKEMPVYNFRSVGKWQMVAVDAHGDVLAIFPGCQVKAWIVCADMPEHRESDCCHLK